MKKTLLGLLILTSLNSLQSTANTEGIACKTSASTIVLATEDEFFAALDQIANHIAGTSTLSASAITSLRTTLEANIELLDGNSAAIARALEVVRSFETIRGPLFVQGSTSQGGYSRTASGKDLENFMMYLQQSIMDYSYSTENLNAFPDLFRNTKFETSSYFPGAVTPPSNENVSYTININGKHVRSSGSPANYEEEDARRPTGCYLAPGSVATVTVPSSLVGIGASILVGAHTWDNSVKPNIRRFDRVTKKYEITNRTVTIANPLGGGVYVNVPFEHDLGILDITLQNVVRSPYYANTAANKTSVTEWQNTERLHEAPWADFESDKVMMQVPTSWIYAVNDPSVMMNDWDMAMDGISETLGRPLVRSKTVVYHQVDLQLRGFANFPGYPFANTTYSPFIEYNGNHNNFMVQGPRNDRSNALAVFFHELGHAEKMYKFNGEIESMVNFLWVPVFNKKFGVDIEEAFYDSSTTTIKHTIDEAAISWMITENFREGNPMSVTTGQFRQEFSYQTRGYAKYADVVQLFGWEALEKFYQTLNADFDAGTYESANLNVNRVPTDSRVLRMSIAAGYDLRPLLHFWGKHSENFSGLANSITESGVEQSVEIYDKLQYYKTIVPSNNEVFRMFGLNDFSESSILNASLDNQNNVSQSYTDSFYRKFWNTYTEEEAQAAIDEIQNIIELYFPDGRPSDKTNTFVPDPNKKYYIDVPHLNLRLAATGESEDAYSTSTNVTGNDVEWKFIEHVNGDWHIQRAAGGTVSRLRTDNSALADMQPDTWNGGWTYYNITEGSIEGAYFLTLPDGPDDFKRLQIDNTGIVRMVEDTRAGTWESFTFTEVVESPVSILLEAEDYSSMFGIQTEASTENGENVGWVNNGDWLRFDDIDLTGVQTIDARVSSETNGGTIEVRLGSNTGALIGSLNVDNTNDWQIWDTVSGTITATNGIQDVFLVFKGDNGYLFNVNWIEFSSGSTTSNKELLPLIDNGNLNVYPNPTSGLITVSSLIEMRDIKVINLQGEVVYVSDSVNTNEATLDLSELSSGMYFLISDFEYKTFIKE